MALDPIVSGTLNQMLEGNSFVEQRDPFKTNIWGEVDTGMMGEIPMWRNTRTGKIEPVDGYPGPVHGPVPFPKYDRSIFGGNDSNTPVPFPKYDRNIFGGDASTMPVPFPALAKGKSPFSTPYWDKQDDIRKYLENIRRLKERGLLGGLPKV